MELINVRVYDSTGGIDASLTPLIQIYDTSDDSIADSGTMTYNSTLQHYQHEFIAFDGSKSYMANIDFGVSAETRYVSFGLEGSGGDSTAIANAVWSANERELTRYQTVGVGNIVKDNSEKLVNTIKDLERLIKGIPKQEEKKDNKELESINTLLVEVMKKISAMNNNLDPKDLQEVKLSIDKLTKDYAGITKAIDKIDIPTMDYGFLDTIDEKIMQVNQNMESNINVFKESITRDLEGIVTTLGNINNSDVRADLTTHSKSMDKIIGMVNIILETIDKEKKEKIDQRKKELEAIRSEVQKVNIVYK